MQIRPLLDDDRDGLANLLLPIFRAGETYALPRDISRGGAVGYWTSAEKSAFVTDPTLAGSYYIKRNQEGGGGHVCNAAFAVAPAARGQGLARRMLAHAEATAVAQGYRAMQFNFVVATNTAAIGLWRHAGFAEVGRLPDAFRHPSAGYVDALVMWKDLV